MGDAKSVYKIWTWRR